MSNDMYIIGLGPGHKDYILPVAIKALNEVSVIIGFQRAMDSVGFIDNKKIVVSSLKEIKEIYNSKLYESIGILASGDPLYYGITNYVKNNISRRVIVIPGISSFQYLSSKLSMPWQGAYVGSMHGREEDFIDIVKGHKLSFWLVDHKFSPEVLCKSLVDNSISATAYVGENLSYDNEKITIGNIKEIALGSYSKLSVLVIECQ